MYRILWECFLHSLIDIAFRNLILNMINLDLLTVNHKYVSYFTYIIAKQTMILRMM